MLLGIPETELPLLKYSIFSKPAQALEQRARTELASESPGFACRSDLRFCYIQTVNLFVVNARRCARTVLPTFMVMEDHAAALATQRADRAMESFMVVQW